MWLENTTYMQANTRERVKMKELTLDSRTSSLLVNLWVKNNINTISSDEKLAPESQSYQDD